MVDALGSVGNDGASFPCPDGVEGPDHATAQACFSMLPVTLTPLVGRESERELALALLRRPEVRLLTLTGPGGIGKTRLALAVAAAAAADFAAGVCFVPLAAVPDAGLVAPAVARSAGLVDAGDIPAQDKLVAALRPLTL